MLDAQSALTEVLQRVVAQDASWTQQQSELRGQERAIKELAVANARLRTQLLASRRRPRAAAGVVAAHLPDPGVDRRDEGHVAHDRWREDGFNEIGPKIGLPRESRIWLNAM